MGSVIYHIHPGSNLTLDGSKIPTSESQEISECSDRNIVPYELQLNKEKSLEEVNRQLKPTFCEKCGMALITMVFTTIPLVVEQRS